MRRINRWLCKKKPTHLLLDGGTLSVPNEYLDQFLEDYIQDVDFGERLCVVENKTVPHFRFFVDVDYVGECELDYVKITECLHEIVGLGPCVLARAKPRDTPKGKKTGMHIIWPESVVTKQKANSIRLKIIEHMGPEWVSVFDPSVYAGSGLRMLWSLKNEEGSTPYIPWGVCKEGAGNFKEFENKSPSVAYLKMFSIRIEGKEAAAATQPQHRHHNSEDLQEFIRKHVPGHENTRILRVTKWKKSEDYCLVSDSKYCENIKRCHKGNHVCFRLTRNGILSQRCNDEECKGFKNARLYRIPSRLIPNEGVLDSSAPRLICDYFPDGWSRRV
jgi:hypothetical protein